MYIYVYVCQQCKTSAFSKFMEYVERIFEDKVCIKFKLCVKGHEKQP